MGFNTLISSLRTCARTFSRKMMQGKVTLPHVVLYEIYAGTSKATHKVFQQRGVSSVREFSILHNLQFFAQKLWLKIGCIFN